MHQRTELLLGTATLQRMRDTRVLLFGTGGVGSWCAECLIRTGIQHLTIVDSDCVALSNLNRQLMATSATIGRPKVEVLRERLLEINPSADILALQKIYSADSADEFEMSSYDFIIDAIDTLSAKCDLILRASSIPTVTFFSCMGAALKCNPFLVRTAEFWKVQGDPLARAIRKKFKKQGTLPSRPFQCVYSEEKPMDNALQQSFISEAPSANDTHTQVNGSLCHITAIFGMSLAGLLIDTLRIECEKQTAKVE